MSKRSQRRQRYKSENILLKQIVSNLVLELEESKDSWKKLRERVEVYKKKCLEIRREHLPRGDRVSPSFHQASEGLVAIKIILG